MEWDCKSFLIKCGLFLLGECLGSIQLVQVSLHSLCQLPLGSGCSAATAQRYLADVSRPLEAINTSKFLNVWVRSSGFRIWGRLNAEEVTDHTLFISVQHLHLFYLLVWPFAGIVSKMVNADSKASNQWGNKLIVVLSCSAPLRYEIVSHEGTEGM